MGLIRLDVPSLVLYGGSIMPGRFQGRDVTVQEVFEAVGANAAGRMSDAELKELEDVACPGAGACGGQFTANTMAMALEFIGLSPMGTAGVPAVDPHKDDVGYRCGQLVVELLKRGLRPSDILTRQAFENAIVGVAASGGSTQWCLASPRHGSRGGHTVDHRGLRRHQLPHAAAGRFEAWGTLCGDRSAPRRRYSSHGQALDRGGAPGCHSR